MYAGLIEQHAGAGRPADGFAFAHVIGSIRGATVLFDVNEQAVADFEHVGFQRAAEFGGDETTFDAVCHVRMIGFKRHQIVVIDQLAASLAAGIETRLPFGALPVQRQKTKPLSFVVRRVETAPNVPVDERVFAGLEVLAGQLRRQQVARSGQQISTGQADVMRKHIETRNP